MLLTYSTDKLVSARMDGTKIHTIRIDAFDRWRPGMLAHEWRGNPRNTRGKIKPFHFKTSEVKGVEEIEIFIDDDRIEIWVSPELTETPKIKGIQLTDEQISQLIKNDGLTEKEFKEWFCKPIEGFRFLCFRGRIIHFTDKKYFQ